MRKWCCCGLRKLFSKELLTSNIANSASISVKFDVSLLKIKITIFIFVFEKWISIRFSVQEKFTQNIYLTAKTTIFLTLEMVLESKRQRKKNCLVGKFQLNHSSFNFFLVLLESNPRNRKTYWLINYSDELLKFKSNLSFNPTIFHLINGKRYCLSKKNQLYELFSLLK